MATALADAEKRAALFQSIMDSMGESVLVVDRNGKQVFANKELRRFQGEVKPGQHPDDWRSPQFMKIYDADGRELPPEQWPVARALRGDYADNFEIRVHGMAHREGETILAISTRSLVDAAGAIMGAVVVTRDITTIRQTEEILRQSQKLETIGQLTGGVAHDFNNMLASITSAVEVIKRGVTGNGRLEQAANIIETAAFRGADLTRHLLAFARKQTLQAVPVEVDALMQETLHIARSAIEATIDVTVEPAPGIYALVDPALLASALLNLCINARDAMPDGGTLTIAATAVTLAERDGLKAGEYVRVSVTDTGTGMSPQTVARAIEPFFTTKGVGKGSGLGLSMVFGFARQSGGDMQIESVEGQGTKVVLFLPRATPPTESAGPPEATPSLGRLRVLVVDDDTLVRDALTMQLTDEGCEVVAAPDGFHALEMVNEGLQFDVLLTDMIMPRGISGFALATAITARRPDVRVILSTGYTDKEIKLPESDGRWTLLNKPYSSDALLSALRTAMLAQGRSPPSERA
ncbi:MAG TPA: ATP-binding protein [Caulobacterales bacterium]|nr:ATP-binding protein [Caulobacterales bacterium]